MPILKFMYHDVFATMMAPPQVTDGLDGAGEATIALRSGAAAGDGGAAVELQLYSGWFCPYAQRVWIALEEHAAAYRWVEIAPYLPPAAGEAAGTKNPKPLAQKAAEYPEFIAASPAGLVPAVDDGRGGHRMHDSMDTVAFCDRWLCAKDPPRRLPLYPAEPAALSAVQEAIAHANSEICPWFYRVLMAPDAAGRAEAAANLRSGLAGWAGLAAAWRAADSGAAAGAYFLGGRFSAADLALFPWFPQRTEWILGAYRPEFEQQLLLPASEAGAGSSSSWLREWAVAVAARPAVRRTLVGRARLVEDYAAMPTTRPPRPSPRRFGPPPPLGWQAAGPTRPPPPPPPPPQGSEGSSTRSDSTQVLIVL
eukprot:SAG22_NODE_687_length_7913_cov_2.611851_7_plen_366_part_00